VVSWKTICSSVPRGGLGVKNLMLYSKALLGKCIWRFARGEFSLETSDCCEVWDRKWGLVLKGN